MFHALHALAVLAQTTTTTSQFTPIGKGLVYGLAAIGPGELAPGLAAQEREEIEARIKRLSEMREAGFEFMEEAAQDIEVVIKDLEPVAAHSFADIAAAAQP